MRKTILILLLILTVTVFGFSNEDEKEDFKRFNEFTAGFSFILNAPLSVSFGKSLNKPDAYQEILEDVPADMRSLIEPYPFFFLGMGVGIPFSFARSVNEKTLVGFDFRLGYTFNFGFGWEAIAKKDVTAEMIHLHHDFSIDPKLLIKRGRSDRKFLFGIGGVAKVRITQPIIFIFYRYLPNYSADYYIHVFGGPKLIIGSEKIKGDHYASSWHFFIECVFSKGKDLQNGIVLGYLEAAHYLEQEGDISKNRYNEYYNNMPDSLLTHISIGFEFRANYFRTNRED